MTTDRRTFLAGLLAAAAVPSECVAAALKLPVRSISYWMRPPGGTWQHIVCSDELYVNALAATDAQISELAIWDHPLSADQITALATGARPNMIGEPLEWWPLDGLFPDQHVEIG